MKKILAVVSMSVLLGACAGDMGSSMTGDSSGSSSSSSSSTGSSGSSSSSQSGSGTFSAADERFFVSNIGDRVFFGYDRATLTPKAISTLRAQAKWLKGKPAVKLTVEGHADERGTREYNLALGERRANAVRSFLVSQGVSMDRIVIVSYGKERPAVAGSNKDAWMKNRRSVSVLRD